MAANILRESNGLLQLSIIKTLLGDHEAARRGGRVGSKDVDSIFDLCESGTEFLGLRRETGAQNSNGNEK